MNRYKIADMRLAAAASFGRKGKRVADIGTDHASLPIYLVGNGYAPYAVACDINKGPLNVAQSNISCADLTEKIYIFLTDGLNGVDVFAPEDVYILGMGGELIWRIIDNSSLPKQEGIRLILQPMTHAHDLRQGLYANGYNIINESLVKDRERVYQIIVAEYDGIKRDATDLELWLGKLNIERGGQELKDISWVYASAIKKKLEGLESAGIVDSAIIKLYEGFKSLSEGG